MDSGLPIAYLPTAHWPQPDQLEIGTDNRA